MAAYYNEFDPYAAQWLRNLIEKGLIAKGEVDERSIVDVRPDELCGFTQCHFFAGIGVWSHALRKAGWPDDRPVWTGSCPCQPFSAAGKGAGFTDERHLWPHFHWLIEQCRPPVVFGEQVASKDGLGWLDLVQADLEGSGYTSGGVDTCAAGFGAPHIRQRLYWMAYADDKGSQGYRRPVGQHDPQRRQEPDGHSSEARLYDGLAHSNGVGEKCKPRNASEAPGISQAQREPEHNADVPQRSGADSDGRRDLRSYGVPGHAARPRPTNCHWRDADWLFCRDGKWRPVEPGTSPLAHGAAARVGRLRGYGNAIVAPQATAFIEAVMETRP